MTVALTLVAIVVCSVAWYAGRTVIRRHRPESDADAARFVAPRAEDVAAATAAYLVDRIKDDLWQYSGTELHGELTVIITTAIRAYFDSPHPLAPEPAAN